MTLGRSKVLHKIFATLLGAKAAGDRRTAGLVWLKKRTPVMFIQMCTFFAVRRDVVIYRFNPQYRKRKQRQKELQNCHVTTIHFSHFKTGKELIEHGKSIRGVIIPGSCWPPIFSLINWFAGIVCVLHLRRGTASYCRELSDQDFHSWSLDKSTPAACVAPPIQYRLRWSNHQKAVLEQYHPSNNIQSPLPSPCQKFGMFKAEFLA